MMDLEDWKKFKRSGGYKTKVKRMYEKINNDVNKPTTSTDICQQHFFCQGQHIRKCSGSVQNFNLEQTYGSENLEHDSGEQSSDADESKDEDEEINKKYKMLLIIMMTQFNA